ncbi:hypothetical protein IQ270_10665 [Microcoleus sp. LEGE 07076]|uniref:hypothetical protein n=1 Tax=Microcoleus sp. LEGE 07076 TaxID=915322 RepID=UPI00187FA459|nr:hypothetical protein [Microcoleus sp. LEGE 07076]MBE9185166.1 hypothetical protein [Microcoleus sp. LEGE 07076]
MTVDCSRKFEEYCMPIAITNQTLEAVGIHLNALNCGLAGCGFGCCKTMFRGHSINN